MGAADRIYAVSRDGSAVVFRAGDRFELLATNLLDDVFNATPAIAHYPTKADLASWCHHEGLEVFHLDMRTGNSWRVGIRRAGA